MSVGSTSPALAPAEQNLHVAPRATLSLCLRVCCDAEYLRPTATRVNLNVLPSSNTYSSHVSEKMRVFISWSGQPERLVAEALREALTEVCAGRADVFVSSQDISKGDRGLNVIEAKLKASDYGIVVLSGANQHRPWINYEGGAMARSLSNPVSTILLDLSPSDVDGPLAPYQSTQFSDYRDMQRLFLEVAKAADPDIPDNTVAVLFTNAWEKILESWQPPEGDDPAANRRSEHDMLAEVVERVRGIETLQQASVAVTASRPGYTRASLRAARPELLKVAIREATDDQIGVGRMSKGAPGVLVVELVENEPTSEPVRKRAYAAVHRLYEAGTVDISLQPLLDPDPVSMRSE